MRAAPARGRGHLLAAAAGDIPGEERGAADGLRRSHVQYRFRSSGEGREAAGTRRADFRGEDLHAPVQNQRQGGFHWRSLAVASGLRHVAPRRWNAGTASHEHRRLPGSGHGDQRTPDAHPPLAPRRQPQSRPRPLDHQLPPLDARRRRRRPPRGRGRHCRAHRRRGLGAPLPREPRARLGTQHHPVPPPHRLPHPQRRVEPHPHPHAARLDRAQGLCADTARAAGGAGGDGQGGRGRGAGGEAVMGAAAGGESLRGSCRILCRSGCNVQSKSPRLLSFLTSQRSFVAIF